MSALTRPAFIRLNYGLQRHAGGGMAVRAISLLPAITGGWRDVGGGATLSASGAFHLSKPSDLVPELQGRLPIRVELDALTPSDFERILTEPNASLTEQHVALLGTENVHLTFTKDGIRRIAEIAFNVNEKTENIGARRLHTVLERLLETVSFGAGDSETSVTVDAHYVNEQLANLAQDEDLSRFIL